MTALSAYAHATTGVLRRLWNSPTITTWMSLSARSGHLLVVLPLVLRQFDVAQIAVWQLFFTILGLQLLIDLGFSPTFSRVIAFAMGGAETFKDLRDVATARTARSEPNWQALGRAVRTMRSIYLRLSVLSVILMVCVMPPLLVRPFSKLSTPSTAWAAWLLLVATSAVYFWSNNYTCFLLGTGHIARLRRTEAAAVAFRLIVTAIVVLSGGGLLAFIAARQSCVLIEVYLKRRLCHRLFDGFYAAHTRREIDVSVLDSVWPSAWRSALGVMASVGIVHLSSLFYAQLLPSSELASYLLAIQLADHLRTFSEPPFYARIPELARLRAEGRLDRQRQVARHGMLGSYSVFAAGALAVALLAPRLLTVIGSNAPFVATPLWFLITLAFFAHRYGALHIQLYSTTNHIVWHIANGVSGLIILVLTTILLPSCGTAAFPLAMLAGMLGFYDWYAARHSYRTFRLRFPAFELQTAFFPAAALIIGAILSLWLI